MKMYHLHYDLISTATGEILGSYVTPETYAGIEEAERDAVDTNEQIKEATNGKIEIVLEECYLTSCVNEEDCSTPNLYSLMREYGLVDNEIEDEDEDEEYIFDHNPDVEDWYEFSDRVVELVAQVYQMKYGRPLDAVSYNRVSHTIAGVVEE